MIEVFSDVCPHCGSKRKCAAVYRLVSGHLLNESRRFICSRHGDVTVADNAMIKEADAAVEKHKLTPQQNAVDVNPKKKGGEKDMSYRNIDGWTPIHDIGIETNRSVTSVMQYVIYMKLETTKKSGQTSSSRGRKHFNQTRQLVCVKTEDVGRLISALANARRYVGRVRRVSSTNENSPAAIRMRELRLRRKNELQREWRAKAAEKKPPARAETINIKEHPRDFADFLADVDKTLRLLNFQSLKWDSSGGVEFVRMTSGSITLKR